MNSDAEDAEEEPTSAEDKQIHVAEEHVVPEPECSTQEETKTESVAVSESSEQVETKVSGGDAASELSATESETAAEVKPLPEAPADEVSAEQALSAQEN